MPARGNLESYTFPNQQRPSVDYDWSAQVHNNGDVVGTIAIGLGLYDGPDSMYITYGDAQTKVDKGYVLWLSADGVPVCQSIGATGKVQFKTEGTYVVWVIGAHYDGTSFVIDTYVEVTVTVSGEEPPPSVYAKAIVESVNMPTTAKVGTYINWSMVVHNIGDTGIFGGGIINYSGPGSAVVLWNGVETELPPSTTSGWIVYYNTEQPNCTRLQTNGQIKFLVKGTYTIYVIGVHQEGAEWLIDDYRSFTVTVTEEVPPQDKCTLKGTVLGLLGRPVSGATVKVGNATKVTDGNGKFDFGEIDAGVYTITVTASMYETYAASLSLVAGQVYDITINLQIGRMLLYGGVAGMFGIAGVAVAVVTRPKVPKVPTGYELVPKAPPGYRLVKE